MGIYLFVKDGKTPAHSKADKFGPAGRLIRGGKHESVASQIYNIGKTLEVPIACTYMTGDGKKKISVAVENRVLQKLKIDSTYHYFEFIGTVEPFAQFVSSRDDLKCYRAIDTKGRSLREFLIIVMQTEFQMIYHDTMDKYLNRPRDHNWSEQPWYIDFTNSFEWLLNPPKA